MIKTMEVMYNRSGRYLMMGDCLECYISVATNQRFNLSSLLSFHLFGS